ncbi:hypothetical protein TCON_2496 [Astathelohania contejeani]|uniref:Uncharacterized protein n=1 Tax=Astathelohania contejeani TaxID=164912 RepID=A0ABQ7HVW3_9MICR|nr:hypothetical protein TCON_2496 [Thelohania contejeani]
MTKLLKSKKTNLPFMSHDMFIIIEYSFHKVNNEKNYEPLLEDPDSLFYLTKSGKEMNQQNKKTGKYCLIKHLEIYDSNDNKIVTKSSGFPSSHGFIAAYEVVECLLLAAKTIVNEQNFISIIQRPVFIVSNLMLNIDVLHHIITKFLINDVWCNEWKCSTDDGDNVKIILWAFMGTCGMEAKQLFRMAVQHNSQINIYTNINLLSQMNFCKLEDILPTHYTRTPQVKRIKKHAYLIRRNRQPIIISPRIYVTCNPQEVGSILTTQYNNCLKVFEK